MGMKIWKTAKTATKVAVQATIFTLAFLTANAQLPDKLLDKQAVDSKYNMKAQDSKLRLKIDQVQGPGTLVDSMEYTVPIKVDVDKKNIVDLGLGQGQMGIKDFDPTAKRIELVGEKDASIKEVLLIDNHWLVYTVDTTKPPQVGDYIWDVKLDIPDHPQSDGSYYPVVVHLHYSRLEYAQNNMMLDTLKLPLEMIYSTFKGEKQVHFLYESLPAKLYPGVDMPEHVKMTTDATFLAMKAKSGLCAGHPEEVVYPITVLSPHTETSSNPDMYSFQNADPQCGRSNASRQFYISYAGIYIRKDTAEAWLGSHPAPTYPYPDDPNKRGPPAFVLNQDSTHFLDFGFKPYADSTDLNHIFYPFDMWIYLWNTKTGTYEAQSTTGELRYNYADIKTVSPDSLIYTINSGNLIGTWNQKDTLVPVGVNEPPKGILTPDLKIFPNPASDEITIQRQSIEPAKYYIYTSHGIQVGEINMKEGETDKKVNLRDLPAGELWITDRKHGLPVVIVR